MPLFLKITLMSEYASSQQILLGAEIILPSKALILAQDSALAIFYTRNVFITLDQMIKPNTK